MVCFHYTLPGQEEVEEAFRQWEETKRSQALVFMGDFNYSNISHRGEQLQGWYNQQWSALARCTGGLPELGEHQGRRETFTFEMSLY